MNSKLASDCGRRDRGRHLYGVSTLNPAAFDHAAQDSPLPVQFFLQPPANLVHALAWFARPGDFEYGLPDFEALAFGKIIYAEAPRGDVFFDLAGREAEGFERLAIRQKHLPATALTGVPATLQPAIGNGERTFDFAHRTARAGCQKELPYLAHAVSPRPPWLVRAKQRCRFGSALR
jgi:hypothetical protein